MNIAIASDHRGFLLKNKIIEYLSKKHNIADLGPKGLEESSDYPDYAHKVSASVVGGEADRGILICGTGIGMSMAANKTPGVRAALVRTWLDAKASRRHNDANVLCMGEDANDFEVIVNHWLATEFEGGRHERRIGKIELDSSQALSD